ncbi:MAG: DUF4347 domain-containing protein, partial [Cyanobacteria bacterium J06631_9]
MTYSNTLPCTVKTSSCGRSVLFIDAKVKDRHQLLACVRPEVDTHVLLAHQDGFEQITNILFDQYRHQKIEAIHIVSHGVPGCMQFAMGELSLSTLAFQAIDLALWEASALHLYGCNVAAGDAGEELLQKLHILTGADVYASSTKVGHASLAGNWVLDSSTLETFDSAKSSAEQVFLTSALAEYPGVLDNTLDTDGDGVVDVNDLDDDNDGILDS